MVKKGLGSLVAAVLFVAISTGCVEDKGPGSANEIKVLHGSTQKAEPARPKEPAAPATENAPEKALRFAFIPKAKSIPVFKYARTGAERQAKELGNVTILWDGPDQNDPQKQLEIFNKFVEDGVDGIAISCLSADLLSPAINAAVDRGIPVITWDSDAPQSKRFAFYGVNDFAAGVTMGQEVQKILGEEGGEIAILTTLGADNLSKRLDGALSVIRQHPNLRVVETFDVKDDVITASRVMAAASKTYPDLRAWLSFGGWPGFSMDIVGPVDTQKTAIICFDAIPPAPKLIKAGKIRLALGQKYFGWGSVPTRALYDVVVNKKYPDKTFIDSGVDLVTPETVDEYTRKWDKMEKGEIVE